MRHIRIISLLLALSLLTACAAAPEQSAVTRKDQQQLIETAGSLKDTGLTIADQVNAPERWEASFGDESGDITVTADAVVQLPHAEQAKMTRVTNRSFTQTDVDHWIQYLFEGERMIDPRCFETQTKSELEEMRLKYQQKLAELEASGEADQPTGWAEAAADPEEGEAFASLPMNRGDELRDVIKSIDSAIADAPEERILKDADLQLHSYDSGATGMEAAVIRESGDALGSLQVVENADGALLRYLNRGDMRWGNESDDTAEADLIEDSNAYPYWQSTEEPQITAQEALQKAEDFLMGMGLHDGMVAAEPVMVLSMPCELDAAGNYMGAILKCWRISYLREIEGVTVTPTEIQGASPEDDQWWAYEKLNVFVNDSGVTELFYETPYSVDETLVENCKLLPFDQIQEIARKMILIAAQPYSGPGAAIRSQSTEIHVKEVRFGYARITETNADHSGLLVPAWTFMGDETDQCVYIDDTQGTNVRNHKTLLTVNAIDGTIIDLDVGY